MVFLLFAMFFVFLGFVPDLSGMRVFSELYFVCKIIPWVISVIMLAVTVAQHYEFMKRYYKTFESMKMNREKKAIYQVQADDLLSEFKNYLLEIYPEFEKSIFETMRPEKITAYMIKYPELKSSETICKLVNLINEKKSKIYNCDLKNASLERDLSVMKRTGKWLTVRFKHSV